MPIDLLAAIGVLDFIVNWGLGWRYLLSPKFRRRIHSKWREKPSIEVAAEALFGVIAFSLLNGLMIFVRALFYGQLTGTKTK